MTAWDAFDELDYKATVTALTEASEMVFESPEARSKWIDERSAGLFFEYAERAERVKELKAKYGFK